MASFEAVLPHEMDVPRLRQLIERIAMIKAIVLIMPREAIDIWQATELGAALLMDKDIIVVHRPGVVVPQRLRAVATLVVEHDVSSESSAQATAEAIVETVKRAMGLA